MPSAQVDEIGSPGFHYSFEQNQFFPKHEKTPSANTGLQGPIADCAAEAFHLLGRKNHRQLTLLLGVRIDGSADGALGGVVSCPDFLGKKDLVETHPKQRVFRTYSRQDCFPTNTCRNILVALTKMIPCAVV